MTVKGNLYYIYTCDKSNKKQLFQIGTPQNAPAHQTVKPVIVTPTTQTVKPVVTPTPTTQTVKPAVNPISAPETPKTPTTNVKIPANQWFNLMGSSGLCTDAHSKIGNRITQVKCTSKKTLKWKFISSKGGYIIKNNNGFVMDNSESKKNNKNPIIANKGKNGPNQIWVPELVNANTIIIRNPESNKCMTVKGNLYYIYTCDKSNKKQLFQIGTPQNAPAHQTVKPAILIISAPETPKTPTTNVKIPANKSFNLMGTSGLCTDAHSKIGERVTQVKCTSKKSLRWKFVPTKGGYIIKNNNDFVLENKESKKDDKNPIIANKGKKGPNQIWVIELTKANKFIIRNPESNKCF